MPAAKTARNSGISMTEVLVVVGIIGVLFVALMAAFNRNQLGRARDATRKDDLKRLKNAFEEYYNDNSCYPARDILLTCNGDGLRPYLSSIPCDPTGQPYVYMPYPSFSDTCSGYRIYSIMEWESDPVIEELNCKGGCGLPADDIAGQGAIYDAEDYSYGVSEGVPVSYRNLSQAGQINYCCPANGQGDCQSYDSGGCPGAPSSHFWSTIEACRQNTPCGINEPSGEAAD
jgi:type II secretory pathway pseudopilin PulG